MEKQRSEGLERRSQEVTRSEKRKREKKEEAGARKGRKVAIYSVFAKICGSGGSKSAEPAGQMRGKKLPGVVARSTCPSQKCKRLMGSEHV